ncbi:SCP-like protein [Oesophagostomum dentatum]|uniref:SCP-like protein n=1 Tax=Oesophagostomum dentatum TaxID=61180 RepID=A0A0B1TGG4_OESDE|nr:SCP-like protein [Oesophagostomum dentatum]
MASKTSALLIIFGLMPILLHATTDCGNNLKQHQRMKFVNMHNIRRASLAKGGITKYNGNNLPVATNMYKMDNNCTLEETAAERAESCLTKTVTLPDGIVENSATVMKPVANKTVAIEKGVSSWWKQIRTLTENIGNLVYYRTKHAAAENFVQMAWGTTDMLGCAIGDCGTSFAIVCHYGQSEVAYDEQIYLPASDIANIAFVCTNCPPEKPNCVDGGLCSA